MGLPGSQNQFVLDLKKCHWTFPLWKKGLFKSRFCGLFIPRLTAIARNDMQARLASLRELQSQTQEELDALLPSVLDKAFKGEL